MAINKLPTPSANYKVVANDTVMRNKINEVVEEVNEQELNIGQLTNQVNANDTKIKGLDVEKITVGNWYYEKYADGVLKMWYSKDFNYSIDTAYQGFFYNSVSLDIGNFPVPFTDVPYFEYSFMNKGSASFFMTVNANTITRTNGGSYSMYRHAVQSMTTLVSATFVGRWK